MGNLSGLMAFGLYTAQGEALAEELIGDICRQVEADALTRKQAVALIGASIERINDIDAGIGDSEPLDGMVWRLNKSFNVAGFKPISGSEANIAYESYRRGGEAAVRWPATPLPTVQIASPYCPSPSAKALSASPAVAVAAAAAAFVDALAPLYARKDGFAPNATGNVPFTPTFSNDDADGFDMSIYVSPGDFTGNEQVGCLLMGGDECSAYLDDAFSSDNFTEFVKTIYAGRKELDVDSLLPALGRVAEAMDTLNLAVSALNDPERLSVKLAASGVPPTLSVSWDGDVVVDTLPRAEKSTKAAMRTVTVAKAFMPDIFAHDDEVKSPAEAEGEVSVAPLR